MTFFHQRLIDKYRAQTKYFLKMKPLLPLGKKKSIFTIKEHAQSLIPYSSLITKNSGLGAGYKSLGKILEENENNF